MVRTDMQSTGKSCLELVLHERDEPQVAVERVTAQPCRLTHAQISFLCCIQRLHG